MKIIGFCCILFLSFNGFSQNSYDFAVTLPPTAKYVTNVDKKYHGIYKYSDDGAYFIFDAAGIWAVTVSYSSISRETVRESSKYTVREGYIFGVVEGDSLPCVLEGERFYFGVLNKQHVISDTSSNKLTKLSYNEFIINFYENGFYTPSFFSFSNGKLTVAHFDYEMDTQLFDAIEEQESLVQGQLTLIHLAPSKKEWTNMNPDLLHDDWREYSKSDTY